MKGSATIEIFARLQPTPPTITTTISSATIEIFARLQHSAAVIFAFGEFCYHRNFC